MDSIETRGVLGRVSKGLNVGSMIQRDKHRTSQGYVNL